MRSLRVVIGDQDTLPDVIEVVRGKRKARTYTADSDTAAAKKREDGIKATVQKTSEAQPGG